MQPPAVPSPRLHPPAQVKAPALPYRDAVAFLKGPMMAAALESLDLLDQGGAGGTTGQEQLLLLPLLLVRSMLLQLQVFCVPGCIEVVLRLQVRLGRVAPGGGEAHTAGCCCAGAGRAGCIPTRRIPYLHAVLQTAWLQMVTPNVGRRT